MIRSFSSHRAVAAATFAQPHPIPPAPRSKRRRGFTLIEILIAMIILGVLSAIAVPAIKDYLAGANDAAMKDDLEKVMADGHLYYTQNNTYAAYPTTRVKLSPNNTLTVVSADATKLSLSVTNSSSGRTCVHATDENPALACN
ncbi:MAG: type IV pilin protein [Gemmatimonadaceae bacterium]